MLKKQFRLNLREQTNFFNQAKKLHTPYFSFFYLAGESFKATVIVPKKVERLASKRNALKRKFRSAINSELDYWMKFKIKLAIVVHPKGTTLSVGEVAQLIKNNAKKIRI